MKYFVFTDFEKWDAINRRPFIGKNTTTTQLLDVEKHPNRDEWLVQIPENSLMKMNKYLTDQEQNEFLSGLLDSYPDNWFENEV